MMLAVMISHCAEGYFPSWNESESSYELRNNIFFPAVGTHFEFLLIFFSIDYPFPRVNFWLMVLLSTSTKAVHNLSTAARRWRTDATEN